MNVSGAFHSPLMADAASRFSAALDAVAIADPHPPVVCNVDALAALSAAELRDRLREQLTSPVRWIACVERLVELGAETLIEVGPGSVLTRSREAHRTRLCARSRSTRSKRRRSSMSRWSPDEQRQRRSKAAARS